MTVKEGYRKVVNFLGDYYQKTKHDELGGLLGDMDNDIFDDVESNDPAMIEGWKDAQEEENLKTDNLDSEQCYQAMIRFLQEEVKTGIWVEDIINELINNPEMKTLWQQAE